MKKEFTLKEIEKLVKLCKKSGVSSLKLGEIEINLSEAASFDSKPRFKARASAKGKSEEERGQLQAQLNTASDTLETLHLEDPLAYERLLLEGELRETEVN